MRFERLILASASPRRRELLESAGLACEVIVSGVDEVPRKGEAPEDYVRRNAREKALGVALNQPLKTAGSIVLAADTIVVSPSGAILEKPRDAGHAREMLESLSHKTHRVVSGFALVNGTTGAILADEVVETRVLFRALSAEDVERYIASGEPFDKAGGYGIQGGAAQFVRAVEGSYTNVVGLPLCEVMEHLKGLR